MKQSRQSKRVNSHGLTVGEQRYVAQYLLDQRANAAGSYRKLHPKANDATARREAHRILDREHVKAYLATVDSKVEGKLVERVALTRQWVIDQLIENVAIAKAAIPVYDAEGKETGEYRANINASNKALELLGKEQGMFIDRSESGRPGEFSTLTDEELERRIKERAVKLGVVVPIRGKKSD